MFDYDNIFFRTMRKIVDCLCLNIIFLISCIPLFTIGTAMTALYYTVCKVIKEDRGYVGKEYVNAFKANFKQGTILWLIAVAIGVFLLVDIKILSTLVETENPLKWGYIVFIIFFALVVIWCKYVFAQLARFRNTTKQIMINAFTMTIAFLPKNVLLGVLLAITVVVVHIFPFFVFFVPVVYTLLESIILESIFQEIVTKEESE